MAVSGRDTVVGCTQVRGSHNEVHVVVGVIILRRGERRKGEVEWEEEGRGGGGREKWEGGGRGGREKWEEGGRKGEGEEEKRASSDLRCLQIWYIYSLVPRPPTAVVWNEDMHRLVSYLLKVLGIHLEPLQALHIRKSLYHRLQFILLCRSVKHSKTFKLTQEHGLPFPFPPPLQSAIRLSP